ncbi:MAG: 4-hydroxy-tetrahydrodipicolinate synthase [Clostridia bacterium]|nr:4-hydroxy-tetrahydrodipicolinate synthase [Clostridia bacterium]
MKRSVFCGVATALITPFKNDASVDYKAYRKLVKEQVDGGADALVTFGTTGEGSTLSVSEKLSLLEVALGEADGKVPVIAASGSNDYYKALSLSKAAAKMGASALLVVTPYYNKTSDNGLIRHFFNIADAVSAPVIIYDVPPRTGVKISAETYKKLALHENIAGSKKADGDIGALMEAQAATGEELSFYCGCDELFLPFLSCGAKGCVSVLSNVYLKQTKRIYELYKAGDNGGAYNAQISVYGLIRALFAETNPIPVKYLAKKCGIAKNVLRPPLCKLSYKARRLLDKEIDLFTGGEKV